MTESLASGSVLLAGLGATGTAAALYLAAAGVGRVSLWDPNLVTPEEARAGVAAGHYPVGTPRAGAVARMLSAISPAASVEVVERESDVAGRIPEHPVVIGSLGDWPDLARVCRQSGSLLVLCSTHGAVGAVAAFGPQGPCLSCLGLERARTSGLHPEERGSTHGAAGVVGAMAATEAVKALLGVDVGLIGRILIYDGRRVGFEDLTFEARPGCRECRPRR